MKHDWAAHHPCMQLKWPAGYPHHVHSFRPPPLPCSNNFVLLKCIEEVTQKALAARAERKQLQVRRGLLGVCKVLLLGSPPTLEL